MPAITVQSLELNDDQKTVLAESFTKIFSEVSKVPEDRIYMFFDGYPLDSCAKGGQLFSQKPPQFAVGNFSK
ncbi:MAG: tautomerase family protein [Clostridiales bacterium]|jgi:4-oxalocrotonate tautomerase|nr:tautomerase family protein [Clostridiales bacterium]